MKKLFTILMLFFSLASFSQITTASLTGTVKTQKGEPVPYVTVQMIYTPTGSKYYAQGDQKGTFRVYNASVGGPYVASVSSVGFEEYIKADLTLNLGDNELNIVLKDKASEMSTVVITGKSTKQDGAFSVGKNNLSTVPTLSRAITDFTKLVPQSVNNSFAGTNFRYNNVTIDGTINNDAIGFSPSLGGQAGTSGMPGSSTRTSPISIDAIKDIQVYVAPFDVKIGNFLGGSINAITRSGSNTLEGSAYVFGRNSWLTGFNLGREFVDGQAGFRIGMPIIKNKLFFFSNQEVTYRREPVFYGTNSGSFVNDSVARKIASFTMEKYGYDVGKFDNYSIYSKSVKFFNRADWNISDKHQLTLRNNTTFSEATNLERDLGNFRFSSQDFKQRANQISTVLELRSHWNKVSNSLVLGYTNIHDWRTPSSQDFSFPQTEISYNGGTIFIGNEREATVFNMKQKTLEITNNFNFSLGKHSFLVGTHNEFYKINYGFVNSWNGRIAYRSLEDYFAGKVNRVRGFYSFDNNDRDYLFNNPYAKFDINLLSLYAQDEVMIKNLKISGGLRLDYTDLPVKPQISAQTPSKYTNEYFNNLNISPRFGFNWKVKGNKNVVLRGGSGIFVGRIPFAWLGYAYYNDGVGFGSFDLNNRANLPQVGDPIADGAREWAFNNGQANRTQVDVIDNNFKMPKIWRSNLAFDRTVNGYKITLEGIYTKTLTDLKFEHINFSQENPTYFSYDSLKQMPIYSGARINSNLSNAYLLTNTNKGYRYQLTTSVNKKYKFGLDLYLAYTYGVSKDITNGIRNSMESNWTLNQSLTPNDPQLEYSNFDIRHRIVSHLAYRIKKTQISLLLNSQSGVPYTWGFINGTLANTPQASGLAFIFKDLEQAKKYIPDVAQAQAFMDFVNSDDYLKTRKGNFTERNGARTPWSATVDMKIVQNFKLGKSSFQASLDIFNFTNMINSNWGRVYFVSNSFNSTASVGLTRTNSGLSDPLFKFSNPGGTPYTIDQIASNWQAQLGIRYNF